MPHAAPQATSIDELAIPVPDVGRRFEGRQRVRLGDIAPSGRLRLDAAVRYLQDVANDDAYDSNIDNPGEWVVRRTVIAVHRAPVLREDLELVTFCSGTGACWAERRTILQGSEGSRIEAAALWVQIDVSTGRPARLRPDFVAVYGPSSLGRKVRAKLLLHADAEPHAQPEREGRPSLDIPFALRRSDLDVLGHVNNAVYWSMLEEAFPDHCGSRLRGRFELEHHHPLEREADVVLRRIGDRLQVHAADEVCAVARWLPLAGDQTSR